MPEALFVLLWVYWKFICQEADHAKSGKNGFMGIQTVNFPGNQ